MKLNSMLLYINDQFPTLADFKQMVETGNSKFWKKSNLFVIEQELIADRFYWIYLQYDNADLYAPNVVDITDDTVKANPRPKNQVEMRNQLFACYDLIGGCLYISDYQKKTALVVAMFGFDLVAADDTADSVFDDHNFTFR